MQENNHDSPAPLQGGGQYFSLEVYQHLGWNGDHGGYNRAPIATCHLAAQDDLAAIQTYLREVKNSPATWRSYCKEIERLLLWCALQKKKSFSNLNRDDMLDYGDFLANPQPDHLWCGPRRGIKGKRFSAGWRPFVGPLGVSAQHTALVILHGLFGYLVQVGYLRYNPISLRQQKKESTLLSGQGRRNIRQRTLDYEQWHAVLHVLGLPVSQETKPDRIVERNRFLFSLLYFMSLRVGEISSHTMGDFQRIEHRWIFVVVGKGKKEVEMPVHQEVLACLQRYRLSMGMRAIPTGGEKTPLLLDITGKHAIGVRQISLLIKSVVATAADHLMLSSPEKAAHLRAASPHWFRHTSISHQAAQGVDLLLLKEHARHSKIDTTMLYVHTNLDKRFSVMQQLSWHGMNAVDNKSDKND